jgi:hypothetical protein
MPIEVIKVGPTFAHIRISEKNLTLTYTCSAALKPTPNALLYQGCLGGPLSRATPEEQGAVRKKAAREMQRARIK